MSRQVHRVGGDQDGADEILLKYDLKFVEGVGRPKSLTAHDLRFNDPDGRIMVRERAKEP
jgi:hypothetical protein